MVDGQVQGDDGITALPGGELLRVVACSIISDFIPFEEFTSFLPPLGCQHIADGQVQRYYGVAAL